MGHCELSETEERTFFLQIPYHPQTASKHVALLPEQQHAGPHQAGLLKMQQPRCRQISTVQENQGLSVRHTSCSTRGMDN